MDVCDAYIFTCTGWYIRICRSLRPSQYDHRLDCILFVPSFSPCLPTDCKQLVIVTFVRQKELNIFIPRLDLPLHAAVINHQPLLHTLTRFVMTVHKTSREDDKARRESLLLPQNWSIGVAKGNEFHPASISVLALVSLPRLSFFCYVYRFSNFGCYVWNIEQVIKSVKSTCMWGNRVKHVWASRSSAGFEYSTVDEIFLNCARRDFLHFCKIISVETMINERGI